MLPKVEYHFPMLQWNRATVAGLGLAALVFCIFALLAPAGVAQTNGALPSVTSMGFGGRATNGNPPSVTSLGFGKSAAAPSSPSSNSHLRFEAPPIPGQDNHAHRHHNDNRGSSWGGFYVGPYYGYADNGDQAANNPDDQDSGGPTIFDRRGGGVARPPASAGRSGDDSGQFEAESEAGGGTGADNDGPQTVLVFKDGTQLEVGNYAIVGSTLYDLTEGHRRKIALADLDLKSTAKENDNRGIDFRLPANSAAN